MPILGPQSGAFGGAGGLIRNCFDIMNLVNRRVPGYLAGDVLSAVNDAYHDVWDQITQLDDSYFTSIATVMVAVQAAEFDFAHNENGNLSAPVSNRIFQLDRIRISQLNDTNMYSAEPRSWNDPAFLTQQQVIPQISSHTPPYYYIPFSKASVLFARPLPVGTVIEVTFSFSFLELTFTQSGTITNAGTAVAGIGTSFTQLLGPDFLGALPGGGQDIEIGVELQVNGRNYEVSTITDDTNLVTRVAITPAANASTFVLSAIPDTPDAWARTIADIATRNLFSTNEEDLPQTELWTRIAEESTQRMKDSVQERTRQANPRVRRFPYGIVRRARFSGVQ